MLRSPGAVEDQVHAWGHSAALGTSLHAGSHHSGVWATRRQALQRQRQAFQLYPQGLNTAPEPWGTLLPSCWEGCGQPLQSLLSCKELPGPRSRPLGTVQLLYDRLGRGNRSPFQLIPWQCRQTILVPAFSMGLAEAATGLHHSPTSMQSCLVALHLWALVLWTPPDKYPWWAHSPCLRVCFPRTQPATNPEFVDWIHVRNKTHCLLNPKQPRPRVPRQDVVLALLGPGHSCCWHGQDSRVSKRAHRGMLWPPWGPCFYTSEAPHPGKWGTQLYSNRGWEVSGRGWVL